MIVYDPKNFCRNLFAWRGSATKKALRFALPCAFVTATFKLCVSRDLFHLKEAGFDDIVQNNVVWTGFTVLLGFLIVFRTSQSYNRFLEGAATTHKMRVEWLDACVALIAFSRHNKTNVQGVANFRAVLVRLFSMLHAVALAEIEDSNSFEIEDIRAFKFDLLDAGAFDDESLDAIRCSDSKPELIYYWINQVAVDALASGVLTIPPPICSRFFQTIANGMVAFHEAVKLAAVPFPFPYTQTCDYLLLIHWLLAPIIVAQWVSSIYWCAVFAFVQVFVVWGLNGIAQELENPFGQDANDLNLSDMQDEMNKFLLMLVDPAANRIPTLTDDIPTETLYEEMGSNRASFVATWSSKRKQDSDVLSQCTEIAYSSRSVRSHGHTVKQFRNVVHRQVARISQTFLVGKPGVASRSKLKEGVKKKPNRNISRQDSADSMCSSIVTNGDGQDATNGDGQDVKSDPAASKTCNSLSSVSPQLHEQSKLADEELRDKSLAETSILVHVVGQQSNGTHAYEDRFVTDLPAHRSLMYAMGDASGTVDV